MILTLFDGFIMDVHPVFHTEVKSKEQAEQLACNTSIRHNQAGLYQGKRCLAAWSVNETDEAKKTKINRAFEVKQ